MTESILIELIKTGRYTSSAITIHDMVNEAATIKKLIETLHSDGMLPNEVRAVDANR